jgi:integrase
MGLGPYPVVSLAAARKAASEARALAKAGLDPIKARDDERARQRLEASRGITFDEATRQFLEMQEGAWKNPKHRQQWRNTLAAYASPKIGSLSVAAIGDAEITRVLDPIWKKKPETASRVRSRMERILDWAKVRGYRAGDNPARWLGHMKASLPDQRKAVKHHAAVAIDEVSAIYGRLYASEGMAARALRFTILTATRAGESTGATWSEVDLEAGMWTIPATRMKMKRDHRVPLSHEALEILKALHDVPRASGSFVFPGWVTGRPLSLTSLSKALKVAGGGENTVHGFRSTFRDWTSERTNYPRDVAEMALAHAIGDKVEAAYRRGDLFTKRAAMMQEWAAFVTTERAPATVLPFPAISGASVGASGP